MAKQMENMRLRQNFRNIWHTDLITSNQNHIRCKFYFHSHTHTNIIYSSHILSQYMQIVALLSGGKSSVPSFFQFFTH